MMIMMMMIIMICFVLFSFVQVGFSSPLKTWMVRSWLNLSYPEEG